MFRKNITFEMYGYEDNSFAVTFRITPDNFFRISRKLYFPSLRLLLSLHITTVSTLMR